jgi:DNA-binding transcriptional ArsR family regulator
MEPTIVTPDATGLKALAHPVRLKILGLLRVEGPATATSLAERLGLNTGATSYHLRQLAQHGFIVEDESRGSRRERWWGAAHQATRINPAGSGAEGERDAQDAFTQAVVVMYAEQLQRAVDERSSLPDEWRESSTLNDWILRLSPTKAKALVDALEAVIMSAPEDDDAETQLVVQLQTFPRPGTLTHGGRP